MLLHVSVASCSSTTKGKDRLIFLLLNSIYRDYDVGTRAYSGDQATKETQSDKDFPRDMNVHLKALARYVVPGEALDRRVDGVDLECAPVALDIWVVEEDTTCHPSHQLEASSYRCSVRFGRDVATDTAVNRM